MPPWALENRRRMGEWQQRLPSDMPAQREAYDMVMDEVLGSGTAASSSSTATAEQVRQASLLQYRRSESNVSIAGFEPLRHTLMLRGRPVQV